jgi:hypothetical protein
MTAKLDITPLAAAMHEAGHAVALWVGQERCRREGWPSVKGNPLREIDIRVIPGERAGCAYASILRPLSHQRSTASLSLHCLNIIHGLSGFTAELQNKLGTFGLIYERDLIRQLIEGDFNDPEEVHGDLWRLTWPVPQQHGHVADRLVTASCAMVHAEWRGIKALGRLLRDRGRLDGDEAEAAWRAARAPEQLRRRREDQAGHNVDKLIRDAVTASLAPTGAPPRRCSRG